MFLHTAFYSAVVNGLSAIVILSLAVRKLGVIQFDTGHEVLSSSGLLIIAAGIGAVIGLVFAPMYVWAFESKEVRRGRMVSFALNLALAVANGYIMQTGFGAAIGIGGAMLGLVVANTLVCASVRHFLRNIYSDDLCPSCGYEWRFTKSSRCPECGAHRKA